MSRNSNQPPNINPTGTRFRGVPKWAPYPRNPRMIAHGTHSKAMEHLLRVMGEYIKADYVVEYSESHTPPDSGVFYDRPHNEPQVYVDLVCKPPLFPHREPETRHAVR